MRFPLLDIEELAGTVHIGIIGGSGLYALDNLAVIGAVYPYTPWGHPSDHITICATASGTKVAFLPRHGKGHFWTPSEVPARANLAALKRLGVRAILAFSAVGSLREEIRPGDFVLPEQIIDRTKGIRPASFFDKGIVGHVPFGDPAGVHAAPARRATLICMEGPAFSTRAESHMYRSWGGDVINMSVLPEAKLAREAEIAYQMVCMATDYDCWREEHEAVTVETVVATMHANKDNAKRLVEAVIPDLEVAVKDLEAPFFDKIRGAAKFAVMTAPEKVLPEAAERVRYLHPQYTYAATN
ncbi:methylthioadenosine phosphorylase [Allomyces macrogynus ATCC 38327]|uniref:S-methyl-5'-thioadenosine phosphorylase n=1 Tax=Allomyces macrogynus (strain ATCC 38327) TaxID=578462 RepID=A0A0L0SJK3_ALLM3|nr:methylthioadenosine phosphorylase [Allomyces macrogynus ATCC 38327]|eukprot:KNE62673.1 methylthioadenosine phosphorylase [Allomyces macrogynus ATCC 38327]